MSPLRVVDFHNHFVGPEFPLSTLDGVPAAQRAFWEGVNRDLSSADALEASLGGIAARVVNTPLEFLRGIPTERINDSVASLVERHRGRLFGLATVDAYGGEPAARELERAVTQLGLRGLFMESAKGSLLPDAPEARPTLALAARLGIPVFLHPVADADLERRFRRFRRLGVKLTRSTINSAALFALLEGGVFDELGTLRVVVTALAFGGVVLAAGMPGRSRLRHDYIDTTGLDKVAVRGSIDILGADRVLVGTDWPVVQEEALPAKLESMFDEFGLGAPERRAIAGENALRLLGAA
jgi:predicted TIM-barrel fold metal-dependent hydrolase